ncbi:hypothetical protein T459_27589 [Capsicum annuum]|uniref:Uncharacterized protein n=1 Tax=Capsicum annuum TaxID=4072 RepID=A0A2G2YEC4_CAPAN|nr:hypothetical protein FXO37_21910 [Capsicum annuum]PHT68102.1 hypothetical protein T459_27589 [Capsicum annuum]
MIAGSEAYLREITDTLKLVEQVIDSREWIFILIGDFVQLMIINTHYKGTVFLSMKRTGVPHRETLGLMNPLSRRSFNYSFNSLSSAGAILYGGIEIGWISRRKSIPKSISLSGETLGRSLGNTCGNSLITKTDSRLRDSELESLTRTK